MVKLIKIVVQLLWAGSMIALGTCLGAFVGWTNHGWVGAIVTGVIGFGVGAFLACSPSTALQLLR